MVDGHSANLLADGLTCLSLKVGVPARLMINQDSSFMKVLQEGSNDIVDLETQMKSKTNIDFQLCPVSGHNSHGLVKAKVNVIHQELKKIDAGSEVSERVRDQNMLITCFSVLVCL